MKMKFKTGAELLEAIRSQDLYCPDKGIYVFPYNEAGSIAYYYIDPEEAAELQAKAKEAEDNWSSFLGPGGWIVDDPSHELYKEGDYTNLEWCEDHIDLEWIPCDEY